ncbi:hypothetical protein ACLOJK_007807 [Asimina triloba]
MDDIVPIKTHKAAKPRPLQAASIPGLLGMFQNLVKMGRAKLAMKLIEDPKARKLTFNKRKNGLMKKALEFSILCDVNTCFICYKKDSGQLITWPESLEAVKPIVRQYLMTSKEERVKREIGLSLLDGKKLARGQQKRTNQSMFPTWDDRLNSWSFLALHKLASILDEKIEMPEEQLCSADDFLHTQAASGTSVMPMPNLLPHFRKFSDPNNFSEPWFQDNQYLGQSHFLPMNPQPLQTILLHPQAHHLDRGWP